MKRIKSILLASAMLLAAPAFLTSCQEDAPEINYTMNVSVINDFTKVVEAINNGSLKNEEAIKNLTAAIDKMNANQQTKLAAIEAAMKAQTLTLESKLALLDTVIKNQTLKQEKMADKLATAIDHLKGEMSEKMEAIAKAIHAQSTTLETKLALVEAAIKDQTLKQEKMADNLITAIDHLKGEMSEKMEAITKAIHAQSTALETKLALAKLGAPWRIPTLEEIQELTKKCTWTWTQQDGVNGYVVKGKTGKSIFLPAAGYREESELMKAGYEGLYWTRTLYLPPSNPGQKIQHLF